MLEDMCFKHSLKRHSDENHLMLENYHHNDHDHQHHHY